MGFRARDVKEMRAGCMKLHVLEGAERSFDVWKFATA